LPLLVTRLCNNKPQMLVMQIDVGDLATQSLPQVRGVPIQVIRVSLPSKSCANYLVSRRELTDLRVRTLLDVKQYIDEPTHESDSIVDVARRSHPGVPTLQ